MLPFTFLFILSIILSVIYDYTTTLIYLLLLILKSAALHNQCQKWQRNAIRSPPTFAMVPVRHGEINEPSSSEGGHVRMGW